MKKFLSLMCALIMVITIVTPVDAKGKGVAKSAIDILVENGYTKESAEALPEAKQNEIAKMLFENPEKVDVSTMTMEVDTLAEIEMLFSYSIDELVEMGVDSTVVEDNKKELMSYYDMEVAELATLMGISDIEAKIFRKAVEKGIKSNKEEVTKHEFKNGVMASGSITSAEMTYTQTIRDISSDTAPEYDVTISYCWKEVFLLESYNDKIVAAWGGGLNTSYIDTLAEYYNYSTFTGGFTGLYKDRTMDVKETIQAGIEFSFPQSVNGGKAKTRSGFACFTLYQTKYQGYDTKVVSYYCHKVILPKDASISISVDGPNVGIVIGTGYHTTAQKASTIGY